jgi:hypothetical protein
MRRIPRPALLVALLLAAVALAAVPLTAPSLRPEGQPSTPASQQRGGEEAGEDGDAGFDPDAEVEGKGKRGATVDATVRQTHPDSGATAPAAPGAGGFSDQARLGFTAGDQWEPSIAADRLGHVYVLYAQYGGVPGCDACLSPTQILTTSADGGTTWSTPRPLQEPGERGWDSQLAVDPVDGRTVWAAWLEKDKSDIMVGRSDDFGATWQILAVDDTNAGTDKPILAVRGNDVYVAYNHTQTIWVSMTHDGGRTWSSTKAQSTSKGKLGWSLPAGGTVTPDGTVVFGWAGYEQNGGAKGPVNLYASRSTDGGTTWEDRLVATSGSPPDCSADLCGWAFLGAQLAIASDDAGIVYGLYNAGPTSSKGAPERMYLTRSPDGGATWSPGRDVSAAVAGTQHAFPALAAWSQGRLRLAWMDNRGGNGSLWNVRTRTSTDGGATLSSEADISNGGLGLVPYVTAAGFEFPFGDYFEVDVDGGGHTHAVFGEGANYDSPGSIWYTRD